jgi:hypothetical protein
MSASLAAAKKRRAPAQQGPPPSSQPNFAGQGQTRSLPGPGQGPQSNISAPGLTLPQVISWVDRRLTILEAGYKSLLETPLSQEPNQQSIETAVPSNITEVLDEFNLRFESLAEEISNLKNIVLSLQTYTMDVNKMLLEDRVHLLSGSGNDAGITVLPEVSSSANINDAEIAAENP